MKSLRCILGFHDWVILDRRNIRSILRDYAAANRRPRIKEYHGIGNKDLKNKVCIRCRLTKYDLDDYISILPKLYEEKLKRALEIDEKIFIKDINRINKTKERLDKANEIRGLKCK